MSEWLILFLVLVAGAGVGVFYYGGLWLTVRHLPGMPRPGLVLLGSFAGRTLLAILAFLGITGGQWLRLVVCLAGFIVARFVVVRIGASAFRPDSEVKPTRFPG